LDMANLCVFLQKQFLFLSFFFHSSPIHSVTVSIILDDFWFLADCWHAANHQAHLGPYSL
jgi:hypothetical protein